MKKTLLVSLLILSGSFYGQKNVEPTAQEITQAKELRTVYDKSDVAILESSENITFEVQKSKKEVGVVHKTLEKLMNINHRASIYKYEFYDLQSNISQFAIKYKNNKSALVVPKDEYYKSNDMFYTDARVKYFQLDFPLQGYTYLYDLEKKTNDIKYFTSVYFNDEYPVINKKISITIPNWLDLEIKEYNFDGFDIKKEEVKSETNKVITYTIKNLPPTSTDVMKPGPSFIYPHLLFISKSFTHKDEKITLFENTSDQYKWYRSLISEMKDTPDVFKDKVTELTKDAKNDNEKIKNIYYWVQDNIRYIAFLDGIAGFKPDDSQNVYNKRYGDCKGMANLTKQMLVLAGFDARLCWIGTNHIAYDYSTPSLSVDNHMICALLKDGKTYFLDGTEKYNSYGEYANRIQGKQVLIEDGENFILDRVPNNASKINKEVVTNTYHIENESLVGNVSVNYFGESRTSFLYQYNAIKNDKKEDALNNYLSSNDKNYKVSNSSTSNLLDRDKTLSITYDVAIDNHVSNFENEIYLDLDYNKAYKSLDFKERKEDFIFDFKSFQESTTVLTIPANYTVSKLPKNVTIDTEDYAISFRYEVKGNQLTYSKQYNFKNGIIKKSNFKEWQQNLETISKNYSEQIVLTKN